MDFRKNFCFWKFLTEFFQTWGVGRHYRGISMEIFGKNFERFFQGQISILRFPTPILVTPFRGTKKNCVPNLDLLFFP